MDEYPNLNPKMLCKSSLKIIKSFRNGQNWLNKLGRAEGTSEEMLTTTVGVWVAQKRAGAAHRETVSRGGQASTCSGSHIYSHTHACIHSLTEMLIITYIDIFLHAFILSSYMHLHKTKVIEKDSSEKTFAGIDSLFYIL